MTVVLGAGADTFITDSIAGNYIYAGAIVGREDVVAPDTTDTEADVIRAGYGIVFSGAAGQPNADIIDLDFGEVVWGGIQTAPARCPWARAPCWGLDPPPATSPCTPAAP